MLIILFREYNMRAFDPATVASAIDLTSKELANLLDRTKLQPSNQGRQGRRRRLGKETVARLDLVVQLGHVGVPAALAARVAGDLLAHPAGDYSVSPFLTFNFKRAEHAVDLDERLRAAAERVVVRRRGRPPNRISGPAAA